MVARPRSSVARLPFPRTPAEPGRETVDQKRSSITLPKAGEGEKTGL